MRLFAHLRISSRLWLLVGLFAAIMIASSVSDISERFDRLRNEKQVKLRHLVESAESIVLYFQQREQRGELSEMEAKRRAIDALRAMRYESTEYFWINDLSKPVPRMVMHPTVPELEGQVMDDARYALATSVSFGLDNSFVRRNGNLFIAMAEVVDRNGHGYITYNWPKPRPAGGVTEELFPKLSYVKLSPTWDWVIGSGIYIDDLDAAFASDLRDHLLRDMVWVLMLALSAWLIGRGVVRPLTQLHDTVDRLKRFPDLSIPAVPHSDCEIGRLSTAFAELMTEIQQSRRWLDASMNEIQSIFDAAPVALVFVVDWRIERVNRAFEPMFGLAPQAAQGLHFTHCFADEAAFGAFLQQVETEAAHSTVPATEVSGHELVLRHGDGRPFWAKLYVRQIDPERRGLLLVIEDVDQARATQQQLLLFGQAIAAMAEGVVVTDASNRIVSVNAAFSRITGYDSSEVIGLTTAILKSGRHDAMFYADMWQCLQQTGSWSGEIWNRNKAGDIFPEWISIRALRNDHGEVCNYVAVFSDITERKAAEKRISFLAHYDVLTSLPNRALLADRLQQAMARSQRSTRSLAVVYLDLDGFKAVNDQHGHDVGDKLLIAVAQRMKSVLRDGDTLARIGGDEFVAVLAELERPEDCDAALGRLLQAAAEPVAMGTALLQVSASIGVTLYPQDGGDADLLLRHADQAMYVAKQAGKNRYHLFDIDHDAAVKTRHECLEQLRHALAQNEFVLYYQPKVNMKTGAVIGAEALIRWQHPERGLLAPAAFLPIIEDHPMSADVGEWVIATALTQIAAWRAMGLSIPVSVNVGAKQLQQATFVPRLAALLAAHSDVPPAWLELEILETSALGDMTLVSELMEACHALGVGFALDDFGTGHSSLTHLRRLPAELLKIDQSFVRDMLDDPDDLAIVEGVIGLATAFRRRVIAEGVETVAHGELLLPLGCELAQGYGIARPMPAAALPDWIATWRPDAAWTGWRDRPLNRDERITIFTAVEYRHWLRNFEAFLAGERDTPPPLDTNECNLGRWMKNEGRARYGERSEFSMLNALHEQVHMLGRELAELKRRGRRADAQARMGELHALRDRLIGRQRGLVLGDSQRNCEQR